MARRKKKNVLLKYEERIFIAFAEVVLGINFDERPQDRHDLLKHADLQLRCLSWDKIILFRCVLWLFELLAITYYGSFTRMSRMTTEKRTRYIRAWHNTWWSTKRMMKRFLDATVYLNYYTIPRVAKEIGYDPKFNKPLPIPEFPKEQLVTTMPDRDIELSADVVVVGSGAGGAAAARELAQKGHSVIVLEEGGWHSGESFGGDTMEMTRLMYRDAGVVNTFGWPFILTPVGCCVGGTTVINSGTCFRAPDAVLTKWVKEHGLAGWEPERMAPLFEQVEKNLGVATARDEVQGASGKFLTRGLEKLGHKLTPLDRNVPECCGSGVCVLGCPTNAKRSSQVSYLPQAMSAGAQVIANVRVDRVRWKGRHAKGVEGRFVEHATDKRGPHIKVNARVVVLACGTLFTPGLLAASGIPDPSGQRGKNLTLHPATKVYGLFDEEVRGWEGIPQGYYCDSMLDQGLKFEGVFLTPAFSSGTILMMGEDHREAMEHYRNLACFGFMVEDATMGSVSRWFGDTPFVWYNINKEDLPKYKKGYAFLAEAFFEAGAKRIYPGIHTLPMVTREQGVKAIWDLNLRSKDLDLQAFHPLGTCQMGADPRNSVVDGMGRVYGVDNVFVADGSIFPTSLGVNPMVTIMASATKIADNISREHL